MARPQCSYHRPARRANHRANRGSGSCACDKSAGFPRRRADTAGIAVGNSGLMCYNL